MTRKYKVSFFIGGEMIGDDTNLNRTNLKEAILDNFDTKHGQSYYSNRDIDTKIHFLKIRQVK
jgi:hypothetical protein